MRLQGPSTKCSQLSSTTAEAISSSISAAWLCKDKSYNRVAMTRVIDRLEAKDLVKRQRSVNDRRAVALELTEAARIALPALRACALRVINQLLCDFSAEETELVQRLLARMLENARLSDLI
jgi:DNA-binding MarR family transcriptional regulator